MAAYLFALALLVASARGMSVRNDSIQSMYRGLAMSRRSALNAVVIEEKRLWPNGYVPYEVEPVSEPVMDKIKKAFAEIEKHSCVKFAPRTPQDGPVLVISRPFRERYYGCDSSLGRAAGNSVLRIDTKCGSHGYLLYLTMRVLGFIEEHLRPDRDDYITVYYENIHRGLEFMFKKYTEEEVRILTAYDTDSITHFGGEVFPEEWGLTTMAAKNGSPLKEPSEKDGLSPLDIEKINKAYKCKN